MPITDVTKSHSPSSSETVIFQPLNIPGAFPKPDVRQTYLIKKYFIIWQKNVKKIKENKMKASNIRIYNIKLSVFSTWMRLLKERKLIKSLIRGESSQFKIINEILEPIPILKSSRVERRKTRFNKKLRFNEQKQVHIFEPIKNDPICYIDENMELDETEDNDDKSSIDMKLYNLDDAENRLMDIEKDSLKEIAFLDRQVNQDMMIEVDSKVLNGLKGIKGINRMTAQEFAKFYEQKYLKYAKRKKNSVWKDALRMYRFGSFESKERQKKLLCLI
ncbi:977_t:CDS:2 [Diversispora eburnea]|uniref:977_t:CDS:1 n=1 Tax=Diversispora eburnea TaxID=1213867 RepID=A0A9N9FRN3_9GLOM|nr:977_t:CDS:2 [Diversispora eburnea]